MSIITHVHANSKLLSELTNTSEKLFNIIKGILCQPKKLGETVPPHYGQTFHYNEQNYM